MSLRQHTKLLVETIDQIPKPLDTDQHEQTITCLCDAGYVGKKLRDICLGKQVRLIVKPRRTRKKGHVLLRTDAQLLREKRNVEWSYQKI